MSEHGDYVIVRSHLRDCMIIHEPKAGALSAIETVIGLA